MNNLWASSGVVHFPKEIPTLFTPGFEKLDPIGIRFEPFEHAASFAALHAAQAAFRFEEHAQRRIDAKILFIR